MTETDRADRSGWLEWRRGGLGGSDAAVLLGLSAFRSPLELWLDKTGQLPDEEPSEAMEMGTAMEPLIAERFEAKTGLTVEDAQACVEHPDRPWMRATLDGRVYEEDGRVSLYEAKATSGWAWKEGVPDHVMVQIQHNLEVTGLDKCWLVVFRGDRLTIQVEEVLRDPVIVEAVVEAESYFWSHYVLPRKPPPTIGVSSEIDALKEVYHESEPESVDLGDEGASLALDMRRAQAAKKQAEQEETRAKAGLMALLGKAELGSVNGEIVASWKAVETNRLDQKKLKEEHPEIVEAYSSVSASRRFTLTQEG